MPADPFRKFGRVVKCDGEVLHSSLVKAPVGAKCVVETVGGAELNGEVVGFDDSGLVIMAERGTRGVIKGGRVFVRPRPPEIMVGEAMLGRVFNGRGEPIDGLRAPILRTGWPMIASSKNPLNRHKLTVPFDVGVRSINGLLTIGQGMRVGLFAGSGVGKTTLLGMIARFARADVVVVGMIGERGREVREFIESHIGEAREKMVVIASPADETAISRVHGAYRAVAVAEYFRASGRNVLLMVDSLTRLAMALREVALAAGEPPVARGYPASVFGALAAYVERAGTGVEKEGAITGIYTVLVEGDDHISDPIADTARSVMDGHIVLSRALAEAAIYPPIDIAASLSRVMGAVVPDEHVRLATKFRSLWTYKQQKQDAVDFGGYTPGRDLVLDEALRKAPAMEGFLRQTVGEEMGMEASVAALRQVV
ncbi:FliI/YscN family ATPase [Acidocella sp.]|uniref:FliI/YscN family ATPase n=1 Tax=Acidocella sp. TaxID=50710 RepID=UPI00260BF7DE|nr:FliI/YscN family ATPase [Acidocella sp.]